MTDYEIDIIEIKATLKKMQEDIKVLENVVNCPSTYQYNPECFKDYPMYDNCQSCSVPPTQATNYWEEHKCQEN